MTAFVWMPPQWAHRLLQSDEDFLLSCWQLTGGKGRPSDDRWRADLAYLANGSRPAWLEGMRRDWPTVDWPVWPREIRAMLLTERLLRGLGAQSLLRWMVRGIHHRVQVQALCVLSLSSMRSVIAPGPHGDLPTTDPALQTRLSDFYCAFEAHFRGGDLDWASHFAHYREWIDRLPPESGLPCVDIGSGRGEWLQHLRGVGRTVLGVELNPGFVGQCQANGLPVVQTDALTWLRSCGSARVAALSAFHLVEHLAFADLFQMIEQAARVLQPGGGILLETPNPENPLVGSHTFYHDPTHRNPVTPSSLSFLLQYHGFTDLQIVRSNPYPPQDQFIVHDDLTNRLNGLLCGPQDYAVLAFKPKA